jgi:transcriptional regulator with XRE-family HTH domain
MPSKDPARNDVARRQGQMLRAARTEAGLTQAQLAAAARIDRSQVIRHESGAIGMTVRSQERYQEALSLPDGYFSALPVLPLEEQVSDLVDDVNRLIALTTQLAHQVARLERQARPRSA